MSFNLARTYMKEATGLYPRLLARGESIIKQGLDADVPVEDIWKDWKALVSEAILNPNFDTRRKFEDAVNHLKRN